MISFIDLLPGWVNENTKWIEEETTQLNKINILEEFQERRDLCTLLYNAIWEGWCLEGHEAGYCADGWYPALQLRKTTVKMQHLKQDCCYCSEAVSGHDVKQLFLFGMGRPVNSGMLAESRCVPGMRSLRKTYLVPPWWKSEQWRARIPSWNRRAAGWNVCCETRSLSQFRSTNGALQHNLEGVFSFAYF